MVLISNNSKIKRLRERNIMKSGTSREKKREEKWMGTFTNNLGSSFKSGDYGKKNLKNRWVKEFSVEVQKLNLLSQIYHTLTQGSMQSLRSQKFV